jgi:hypothetical protein
MAANLRSHILNVESATNAFNFGTGLISEFGLEGSISWLRRIDLELAKRAVRHGNAAAEYLSVPEILPEGLSGHPAACGSAAKP